MFCKNKIKDIQVIDRINYLRKSSELHLEIYKQMVAAENGTIYPLDLLATATINRSLNLLIPFCDLIEEKNIIATAPLIRMQLDNLLRFYAVYLVEDPHEFSVLVMEGEHIRNLRDKTGKKMTDEYLHKKLSSIEKEEWITNVYKKTSGYIHLSGEHIMKTIFKVNEKNRQVTLKIGYGEQNVEDFEFIEAIEAFIEITQLLFKYLNGWSFTKENPNYVK